MMSGGFGIDYDNIAK